MRFYLVSCSFLHDCMELGDLFLPYLQYLFHELSFMLSALYSWTYMTL